MQIIARLTEGTAPQTSSSWVPLRLPGFQNGHAWKYLESRDGIGDILLIGGDVQQTVELVSLAPGGGVLLVNGGLENFNERFLCSMESRFRLHADGREISQQGFLCEKVRLKWKRKIRYDTCVRQ